MRWILAATPRSISILTKVQKEQSGNTNKSEDEAQQTIIELKEENLGQLKERKLDVTPASAGDNQNKKEKQAPGTSSLMITNV